MSWEIYMRVGDCATRYGADRRIRNKTSALESRQGTTIVSIERFLVPLKTPGLTEVKPGKLTGGVKRLA